MLRKYKLGLSIIETVLSVLLISTFLVLLMKLNHSIEQFDKRSVDKHLMYTHFYNIIQIIKSDPDFYSHVEEYYNINGEKVHQLSTSDNKRYYISIYFDQFGNLTYQSNAYYFIYISLSLNDYTDYYDYYYLIRIDLSHIFSSQAASSGVYLHYSKNK